jgi:hypothetical protein
MGFCRCAWKDTHAGPSARFNSPFPAMLLPLTQIDWKTNCPFWKTQTAVLLLCVSPTVFTAPRFPTRILFGLTAIQFDSDLYRSKSVNPPEENATQEDEKAKGGRGAQTA